MDFSELREAKHIPVGETLLPTRQGAQITSICLKIISPSITTAETPMVIRVGMKLCLSCLIPTPQKLTWEQHNSFRPAKGTEASMG